MDFEPCWFLFAFKSMKLGQMTNLNVIFHMVGSVYRLVTIRNSPQFPVEFRNGLFDGARHHFVVWKKLKRARSEIFMGLTIFNAAIRITFSFAKPRKAFVTHRPTFANSTSLRSRSDNCKLFIVRVAYSSIMSCVIFPVEHSMHS